MTKKNTSFRDQMRDARPDVEKRQRKNAQKHAIAQKLRALRDARGMTQADVARASDMTQSMIARLEALTGPIPGLATIERYVEACEGHMAVVISPEAIELTEPEAA